MCLTHFSFSFFDLGTKHILLFLSFDLGTKNLVNEQLTVHSLPPFQIYSKRRWLIELSLPLFLICSQRSSPSLLIFADLHTTASSLSFSLQIRSLSVCPSRLLHFISGVVAASSRSSSLLVRHLAAITASSYPCRTWKLFGGGRICSLQSLQSMHWLLDFSFFPPLFSCKIFKLLLDYELCCGFVAILLVAEF